MSDPESLLVLAPSLAKSDQPIPPLTTTANVYAGPGLGLAEIQVTIEPPHSHRGKLLAVGVPRPEVEQIIGSILKIPSLVGRLDYSVTCRLIGADKYHRTFGLGLCVAVIASYFRRPIPPNMLFVGEIDLRKRIRGGTPRLVENLRTSFDTREIEPELMVILPSSLRVERLAAAGVRVVACETLADVAATTWPVEKFSNKVEKTDEKEKTNHGDSDGRGHDGAGAA